MVYIPEFLVPSQAEIENDAGCPQFATEVAPQGIYVEAQERWGWSTSLQSIDPPHCCTVSCSLTEQCCETLWLLSDNKMYPFVLWSILQDTGAGGSGRQSQVGDGRGTGWRRAGAEWAVGAMELRFFPHIRASVIESVRIVPSQLRSVPNSFYAVPEIQK